MRDARQLVIAPVISEKSYALIDSNNTYTFIVDPRARKDQIKRAVEEIFDVTVASVNTQNRKGKLKRTGAVLGRRARRKRAFVKLTPESRSIDVFKV